MYLVLPKDTLLVEKSYLLYKQFHPLQYLPCHEYPHYHPLEDPSGKAMLRGNGCKGYVNAFWKSIGFWNFAENERSLLIMLQFAETTLSLLFFFSVIVGS